MVVYVGMKEMKEANIAVKMIHILRQNMNTHTRTIKVTPVF